MQPDLISRKAALEALEALNGKTLLGSTAALQAIERLPAVESELVEALDPVNVRAASKALIAAGNGLLGGLLILMADKQDAAIARARGEQP